jgi:iron(III) transport system substrate-binding protein
VERSALVASWGEFTADGKGLTELAKLRADAVKIMETVNFDG